MVVAFNGGLEGVARKTVRLVKERLANFLKSMPNVSFIAWQRTGDAREGGSGRR